MSLVHPGVGQDVNLAWGKDLMVRESFSSLEGVFFLDMGNIRLSGRKFFWSPLVSVHLLQHFPPILCLSAIWCYVGNV